MRIIAFKYDYILPLVIEGMFPDKKERESVIQRLEEYGKEDWHPEPNRVRLAILKFTFHGPRQLDEYVDIACSEYRDILYFAETPLSIADWGQLEKDPNQREQLVQQDRLNYLLWIDKVIANKG